MKKNQHIRERDIEKYLVKKIEDLGGRALKFSSPGNLGVPDRICVLPKGGIIFVECKAPGKVPTPLQWRMIKILRSLDQTVIIINSKEMVDTLYEVTKEELKNEKRL